MASVKKIYDNDSFSVKRVSDPIKDFVKSLSDENLLFLNITMSRKIGSDLADSLTYLQKNPNVDDWLKTANNWQDFFNMIDYVEYCTHHEIRKRANLQVPANKNHKVK